ncbi:MAG: DUF4410 domain-containing protein [Planctomycetota bacterium]|jgi:hypothetical protein
MQRHKYSRLIKKVVRGTHLPNSNSFIIGLLVFFVIMGCTSAKVELAPQYLGQLPKPDLILVHDLAVEPDEIELGRGVTPKITRLVKGSSRTEEEVAVGRAVAGSLSKHLVQEIQDLGFPAERATGAPLRGQNVLEIEGQFLSIDEGNRTERVIIGLGLGRTEVKTNIQLYDVTPQGRRLVEEFETDAKSGRKPGMGEFVGVGALAGHAAVSALASAGVAGVDEAFMANVEADARRTAKEIAKQLKQLFVKQGWISG